MDFIFGILGFAGGLLCAVGDILFDLKGKGNVKSGPASILDSNWMKMPEWRFRASILMAALGVPLYLLGFIGMSRQLSIGNSALGTAFLVFAAIGSCGGFFIHAMVCCFPIMRKSLTKSGVDDNAQYEMFGKVFNAIKIPFIAMFCSLVVATSVVLIVAILVGCLQVPLVFVALNPLALMLIGLVFRLIDKERFADLPGIIMPSLGIAMIGLMAAISAWH